jgi:hypothetical protein
VASCGALHVDVARTVDRYAESLGFVVQYHLIPTAKANESPAVVVHV